MFVLSCYLHRLFTQEVVGQPIGFWNMYLEQNMYSFLDKNISDVKIQWYEKQSIVVFVCTVLFVFLYTALPFIYPLLTSLRV